MAAIVARCRHAGFGRPAVAAVNRRSLTRGGGRTLHDGVLRLYVRKPQPREPHRIEVKAE
ncbi:MAG TPA: hypothetical protein VFS37_12380 [Conexibacter sp.]|nr:hypothetical protein [Conexibacter sp.]